MITNRRHRVADDSRKHGATYPRSDPQIGHHVIEGTGLKRVLFRTADRAFQWRFQLNGIEHSHWALHNRCWRTRAIPMLIWGDWQIDGMPPQLYRAARKHESTISMNVTLKLPDELIREARHRAVNPSQSLSA